VTPKMIRFLSSVFDIAIAPDVSKPLRGSQGSEIEYLARDPLGRLVYGAHLTLDG
jgi:hypothetical protein